MTSSESHPEQGDLFRQLLIEDWLRAGITDLMLDEPAEFANSADRQSAATQPSPTPRQPRQPEESASPKRPPQTTPPVQRSAAALNEADAAFSSEPLGLAERQQALAKLQEEVAVCSKCLELADRRTQTVFGVGNPQARLCFLGEAPGADEDRQGEPFVGRAGKLLTRIIEACQMTREEVYILNVLKCRPPGNRAPLPLEADNCRSFLDRQLEIIRPEFLVCLGASAAQTLLQTTEPIGRLRGRFYRYRGIRVLATYHPAYLLRTPSAKRPVWEDMKLLMAEMGIELPTDSS